MFIVSETGYKLVSLSVQMHLIQRLYGGFLLLIFLGLGFQSTATHNRAGEVTYTHISGFTYEIKIVTCTKSTVIADREWLSIDWGDNPNALVLDSLQRNSIESMPEIQSQINTYIGRHTYPGAGAYSMSVLDPNRNSGVQNIPISVSTPFCIVSELIISPNTGHNNSVILLNPPKEQACLNKLWIHNPAAFDPDGDLLTFKLVTCLGELCEPIPGYEMPDVVTPDGSDTFTIDSQTGDVVWEYPTMAGEYNIAILVEEWREVNGTLFKVGSVIRDMQIDVSNCDNDPPIIEPLLDTCIVLGEQLTYELIASDPNGDNIILSAIGAPLESVENTATFNPSTGLFSWIPGCEEVRVQPYYVHFKAEDTNWQVQLVDLETVGIRVVAPSVENVEAEPSGNSIVLTWDPHDCLSAFPTVEYHKFTYKIYRRNGFYGFEPDHCETGVPSYTGYQLVGEVEGFDSNTFVDDFGVGFGGEYCYMIVTCWPDGAESLASEEVCAKLIKDQPVPTNVSVEISDDTNGEIYVAWSPPSEMDTINFTPPYTYRLFHGEGFAGANDLIWTSPPGNILMFGDTTFTHTNIDTENTAHNYSLEFWSGDILVAKSQEASSVWISTTPNDNQLTINIDHTVPWQNYEYDVFRFDDQLGDFVFVGLSEEQSFTDTGLVNNVEYCYRVQSRGTYNVSSIIDPILNWSQEVCGIPYDLTPPCPPELTVDNDCELILDNVSWTNPNDFCADDVVSYELFYTPILNGEYESLGLINSAENTSYIFNEFMESNSIAGCFYIVAMDSLLPGPGGLLNQNISEPSNIVCVDNCPIYFLPNTFSPNQDGSNDLFHPFPYKFVEDVDFKIFNRWGNLVFETTDPDIGWDGTYTKTGEVCADGVYYYTIQVNTIRLEGIVPESFSGSVHIFGGRNPVKE